MGPRFDHRLQPEQAGNYADLRILEEDPWLQDTEVKYHLRHVKKQWVVSLVFISIHNPFQFIKHTITYCTTYRKACIYGDYYRRIAAKDPRGYLKTDLDQFQLCLN
ncbi:MAG: hypothetical protein AAF798_04050 [Bacteroidota bacterium]